MRKIFLHALLLSIPMLLFFTGYVFNHSSDIQPTGFIQYDNVSYIAYAKQYIDADTFHLQYSNPFNESGSYKPIYFQPQTIFFALLLKLGIPPGRILIPFTIICSLICFVLLIRIYDLIMPDKKFRTFNTWLFAWGGGLLAVAGFIALYALGRKEHIDPESGWWGLNFGRSLFFTCEAYYHALFLGSIYLIIKRKYFGAAILMFILSLSHPFTGLELAAIVCAWCVFEFLFRKKEIPIWFCISSIVILCFHLYYYLVYLEQFADHRSVSEQYTLTWRLGIYRILPAYFIVGALTIVSIYKKSIKGFFEIRSNRIFLCWFIVAFLLANHEVFMKARQPIHFTRGYIWTSLFLLGIPALQLLNKYLQRKAGIVALAIFSLVFFFDNFLWISQNSLSKANEPYATHITTEQKEIFTNLNGTANQKSLIVSSDNTMAYLSSVYTKAYPWYSHPYTTPFAKMKLEIQDRFFNKGVFDTGWIRRDIYFILQQKDTFALSSLKKLSVEKILETNQYSIYHYRP